MKVRADAIIKGRVQGVFFRARVQELALNLGIKGWVKNVEDTSVEVMVEGEESDVQKLIDFCKRGPAGASVADFKLEWQEFKGEFKDFKIIYR